MYVNSPKSKLTLQKSFPRFVAGPNETGSGLFVGGYFFQINAPKQAQAPCSIPISKLEMEEFLRWESWLDLVPQHVDL